MKFWVFLTVFSIFSGALQAQDERLRVYIDADFTRSFEIGDAIALGIRTALREVEFQVAGAQVQIIDKNHKGNIERSFRNLQGYLRDNQALAIFGGMHSPPYLKYKDFINSSGILTLLPWSAAGPITRASPGSENWIFRLSVDDSKAGRFLVNNAIEKKGCQRLALLLIDTGWGRANRETMLSVLAEKGITPSYVNLFPELIGEPAAKDIIREVRQANADCAILLAQATEAAYLSQALFDQAHQLTLISHWAILGARYPQTVDHEVRQFIGLQVLQSCGLRVEQEGSEVIAQSFRDLGREVGSLSDISAPAGFVHGYDLARVFIAATEQAATTEDWDNGIEGKRAALRAALEDLKTPVVGILKTYQEPFAPYGPNNADAHEALGAEDLCLAEFDQDGRLQHASDGS